MSRATPKRQRRGPHAVAVAEGYPGIWIIRVNGHTVDAVADLGHAAALVNRLASALGGGTTRAIRRRDGTVERA